MTYPYSIQKILLNAWIFLIPYTKLHLPCAFLPQIHFQFQKTSHPKLPVLTSTIKAQQHLPDPDEHLFPDGANPIPYEPIQKTFHYLKQNYQIAKIGLPGGFYIEKITNPQEKQHQMDFTHLQIQEIRQRIQKQDLEIQKEELEIKNLKQEYNDRINEQKRKHIQDIRDQELHELKVHDLKLSIEQKELINHALREKQSQPDKLIQDIKYDEL